MNHFWLADLLATVGDFPNAILHFSEVIATKEPYFINIAHFFRAECHLRVKEYAKAIEDIESVPVGLPYYPRPREMVLDEAKKGLASEKK